MTENDFLKAVDNIIIKVHETKDLTLADNALDSLIAIQQVTGRARAKLLWSMQRFWDKNNETEKTGDTFEDRMMTRHGLKKEHMDRYIRVWEVTDNNKLPKQLWTRPMKDQIAIATMLCDGRYDPSKEEWKKLERAQDNNEVLEIIRAIKKKPPKKGSLQITLSRNGDLHAWEDNKKTFIGYLDVKNEDKIAVVKKAITRINKNSGIKRQ